jgi:hypothetical protein
MGKKNIQPFPRLESGEENHSAIPPIGKWGGKLFSYSPFGKWGGKPFSHSPFGKWGGKLFSYSPFGK